ncbi:hypothetical protein KM043_001138 [Ampulex compressa]|nr:hypothetical protein KM043_001138 [Ampulex compressa]
MDRSESANEGGSSPDTVVARSSSEEDRKRTGCTTSGEYVTVGDSSSSLDALQSREEKKRAGGGRFVALRNSFRKEGGLFKIKRKIRTLEGEEGLEEDEKESERKPQQEEDEGSGLSQASKKKKKKSHSLVRKLSLSKFRLSAEQETTRHTPEGGDSSRSQSQSSQDSPTRSASPSRTTRKGLLAVPVEAGEALGGEESRKAEKLLEKPISTITVVQRRSPSLTIRSFSRNFQNESTKDPDPSDQSTQCSSTLPYAISKWPEQKEAPRIDPSRKKLSVKSDSESALTPKSSPIEVRRKLSLLEEKRALFQRRIFDSSRADSGETVIASALEEDRTDQSSTDNTKKRARHISVRKFDTFSTFEGTFDEDTGVGYLAGIEEDYTESYDRADHQDCSAAMAPMVGTSESIDRSKTASQDSTSSQNNAPSGGTGEKREHLYKILVIGELGAGKTSIIKRYVHQFFSQHYRATIGVDFALKVLNWDPHTIIRLQLWDIAGQERFGNMTRVYYKEAVGAFIVFDVTRSATLDAVVKWKQDLDSKVQLPDGSPIPCVLLANKCDQQKEGLVNSPAKMDEYCKEKNFSGWFETSAKENINIEEAARFLVNKILHNDQLMKGNDSQDQTDGERFALNQSPASSRKSCSC